MPVHQPRNAPVDKHFTQALPILHGVGSVAAHIDSGLADPHKPGARNLAPWHESGSP